jgi:enoyl-CoA hydratase
MSAEIKSKVTGKLGRITLNRPKALNALTYSMCEEMTRLLVDWENDPNIGAVVVDGAGDRAFCAGGDVILLHDSGKAGDKRAENFWRVEYALNDLIHRYKKPYIAMIDGIVMGGGVGLSVHGRHRVAGDTTFFAMPETGIGYFPDVGGTFFLPRLGMAVGQWLGLTGARLKTAQVCELGIANSYIPSDQHDNFIKALGKADLDGSDSAVLKVMIGYVKRPQDGASIPEAVHAFDAGSVTGILASLDADGSEWAVAQADNIRKKSPVALAVTFEAIKRGAKMNFREAMSQELDISLGFLKTQDFYEGIRAQLIDKDRNPKWSADDLTGVTAMEISRHFVPHIRPLKFLD